MKPSLTMLSETLSTAKNSRASGGLKKWAARAGRPCLMLGTFGYCLNAADSTESIKAEDAFDSRWDFFIRQAGKPQEYFVYCKVRRRRQRKKKRAKRMRVRR